MYSPPYYRQDDAEELFRFMVSHPFILLISNGCPEPFVTHLPVVTEKEENGQITVFGHMALANPQWKSWQEGTRVTAVFHGPHAYVSPAHYTSLQNVPTWNYIAVHATGSIKLTNDKETMAIMEKTIMAYDANYMQQYRGLDERYREGLLKGVAGFHLIVDKLEGKYKLNQNKPEQDRINVVRHFEKSEDSAAREMVEYMKRMYSIP
jgi:transcriptional regulator